MTALTMLITMPATHNAFDGSRAFNPERNRASKRERGTRLFGSSVLLSAGCLSLFVSLTAVSETGPLEKLSADNIDLMWRGHFERYSTLHIDYVYTNSRGHSREISLFHDLVGGRINSSQTYVRSNGDQAAARYVVNNHQTWVAFPEMDLGSRALKDTWSIELSRPEECGVPLDIDLGLYLFRQSLLPYHVEQGLAADLLAADLLEVQEDPTASNVYTIQYACEQGTPNECFFEYRVRFLGQPELLRSVIYVVRDGDRIDVQLIECEWPSGEAAGNLRFPTVIREATFDDLGKLEREQIITVNKAEANHELSDELFVYTPGKGDRVSDRILGIMYRYGETPEEADIPASNAMAVTDAVTDIDELESLSGVSGLENEESQFLPAEETAGKDIDIQRLPLALGAFTALAALSAVAIYVQWHRRGKA